MSWMADQLQSLKKDEMTTTPWAVGYRQVGAAHLFEEPGALGKVAKLAAGWFAAHLK